MGVCFCLRTSQLGAYLHALNYACLLTLLGRVYNKCGYDFFSMLFIEFQCFALQHFYTEEL